MPCSINLSGKQLLRNIQKILLVLFLYIYLYNPIFLFLGIGSIKPLLIIAILYAIIDKRVFNLLLQFKYEVIFTFILIIYTLLATLRGDMEIIMVPYQHFIWFMESIFLPVVFVIWFRAVFSRYNWEKWIVIAGFIASLISLTLILNPEWNEFVRSSLLDVSLSDDDMSWFRGFGLAEGLAGSYGVIQGIILGMCLYMVRRHAMYVVPVLPLLISIAFNARTGFAAVIIALILLIAARRLSIQLVAAVFGIALIIVCILNSESEFIYNNYKTLEWVMTSFIQTGDFLSGNSTGNTTLDTLLIRSIFYPENAMGLLFGEGIIPYFHLNHSDVGYINELMFGGIVYLLLLLSFLAYMYMRVCKKNVIKFYSLFFVFTLLIFNVKSTCLFIPGGVFRLFSLYYVLIITNRSLREFQPLLARDQL